MQTSNQSGNRATNPTTLTNTTTFDQAANLLNPATLTDLQLYTLSKKYGKQARLWRQKFIGLIPEINRRGIYKDKGFHSIFEFAAKLGGVSHEHVKRVISIEKKFEENNLRRLNSILTQGEISVNKLARIASVANQENEEEMLDAIKTLSQSAIETYVRDEKYCQRTRLLKREESGVDMFVRAHKGECTTKSDEVQVGDIDIKAGKQQNKEIPTQPKEQTSATHLQKLQELGLKCDVVSQLAKLKNQGHDINKILIELLNQRKEKIRQEKLKVTEEVVKAEATKKQQGKKVTRHIPVKVKRVLQKEYGMQCSIPQCKKQAKHLHHTVRFGLHRSHDPRFIAPLCREHHDITHALDLKYREKKQL